MTWSPIRRPSTAKPKDGAEWLIKEIEGFIVWFFLLLEIDLTSSTGV